MSITVTITDDWSDGKRQHVVGTLTFAGTYATGGEAITWSGFKIKSKLSPVLCQIEGIAGYHYEYVPSTKKVIVRGQEPTSSTAAVIALSEHAAATYVSAVSGDTVTFYAIFKQLT